MSLLRWLFDTGLDTGDRSAFNPVGNFIFPFTAPFHNTWLTSQMA
jgi:hypothetical protein